MHDPSTLLFDIRLIRLDVWHDEPNGHDSGTVCGHAPMKTWPRLRWGIRHVRHLHYRFWPYLRIHRWITHHCADCGRRFLWKDARHGYQSSDQVWHSVCMSLRTVQSHLDDLTAHVQGAADWNTSWRAKYRLEHLARVARRGTEHGFKCEEPTCPDFGDPDFGEGTCPAGHAEPGLTAPTDTEVS
jgi:hypothetical protein